MPAVSRESPDGNAFSGGLRAFGCGSTWPTARSKLFVVNHLDDVIRTIRQATGHPV